MDWRKVRDKINREAEKIWSAPPDEILRLFKYQIVPSGQGINGQAFTTMVFASGDIRSLAYYNVLGLTRVVDEPSFTVEQMKILFKQSVPISAEFLWTCGIEKIWELVQDVLGALDTVKTKDDFRELIDALMFYAGNLHDWAHWFFPWYIGELYPQRKADDIKKMAELMG